MKWTSFLIFLSNFSFISPLEETRNDRSFCGNRNGKMEQEKKKRDIKNIVVWGIPTWRLSDTAWRRSVKFKVKPGRCSLVGAACWSWPNLLAFHCRANIERENAAGLFPFSWHVSSDCALPNFCTATLQENVWIVLLRIQDIYMGKSFFFPYFLIQIVESQKEGGWAELGTVENLQKGNYDEYSLDRSRR